MILHKFDVAHADRVLWCFKTGQNSLFVNILIVVKNSLFAGKERRRMFRAPGDGACYSPDILVSSRPNLREARFLRRGR